MLGNTRADGQKCTTVHSRRLTTIVIVCTLLTAFLVWQVVSWGTLSQWDVRAARTARSIHKNRDFFEITVMAGLRGIILTVCLPLLAWRSWRDRSWMPIAGFVLVLLFETGLVGALKMAIGRSFPYQGPMVLEAGFLAFPSGHAGNVVALWGWVAWFYSRRMPRWAGLLWSGVVAATVMVAWSSWMIRTHWPTDLAAGFALGLIALATTVEFVRAVELSRAATAAPAPAARP